MTNSCEHVGILVKLMYMSLLDGVCVCILKWLCTFAQEGCLGPMNMHVQQCLWVCQGQGTHTLTHPGPSSLVVSHHPSSGPSC